MPGKHAERPVGKSFKQGFEAESARALDASRIRAEGRPGALPRPRSCRVQPNRAPSLRSLRTPSDLLTAVNFRPADATVNRAPCAAPSGIPTQGAA